MKKMKFKDLVSKNIIVVVLIVLSAGFGIANKNFFSSVNIINLLSQMCVNALLASGLSYPIILGGVDVSVGSAMAVSGVLAALVGLKCFPNMGYGVAILDLVLTALIVGLIIGFLIGYFISYCNVVPMICTVAFQSILRGVSYIISGGGPIYGLPDTFGALGSKRLIVNEAFPNGMIPVNVIFTIIVVIIAHIILTKTVFGRHVFAVGSNRNVAHLAGINVKKITLLGYVICTVCACLAGVVTASRLQNGQPNIGEGYEMFAIASCVLGGTSLAGGRGSIARAMFGVATIAVINNGMNMLNISAYWQKVVLGVIILGAVIADMREQKKKKV